MKIKHHPDLSSLMSCAAGSQPEAFAAVISSHLAVCPQCRAEVRRMQKIGEVLLDGLQVDEVDDAAVSITADRALASCPHPEAVTEVATVLEDASDVPHPLRSIIGDSLDEVPWKWAAPGIWHYTIPLSDDASGELRLLKVGPGKVLPDHGHGGNELTLVLRGSYTDHTGTYRKGDVADLDENIEHQPVTCKDEGCICLIAYESPARYKDPIARMLQPILRL